MKKIVALKVRLIGAIFLMHLQKNRLDERQPEVDNYLDEIVQYIERLFYCLHVTRLFVLFSTHRSYKKNRH